MYLGCRDGHVRSGNRIGRRFCHLLGVVGDGDRLAGPGRRLADRFRLDRLRRLRLRFRRRRRRRLGRRERLHRRKDGGGVRVRGDDGGDGGGEGGIGRRRDERGDRRRRRGDDGRRTNDRATAAAVVVVRRRRLQPGVGETLGGGRAPSRVVLEHRMEEVGEVERRPLAPLVLFDEPLGDRRRLQLQRLAWLTCGRAKQASQRGHDLVSQLTDRKADLPTS